MNQAGIFQYKEFNQASISSIGLEQHLGIHNTVRHEEYLSYLHSFVSRVQCTSSREQSFSQWICREQAIQICDFSVDGFPYLGLKDSVDDLLCGYKCREFSVKTCRDELKKVCKTQYKKVCKTDEVLDCHDEYRDECQTVYADICKEELKHKCKTMYTEVCEPAYGYEPPKCENVPKEMCDYVPENVCTKEPKEKCTKKKVPVCQTVPKKTCKNMPEQVCKKVPTVKAYK